MTKPRPNVTASPEAAARRSARPANGLLWPLLLAAALMAACGGEAEQEITCVDGIMNGDETDVDCGGSCPPCLDGLSCLVADDCLSGWCHEGQCASESCDDGVKNGGETDVDCGGPDCPPCELGQSCERGDDCVTGLCEEGICAVPEDPDPCEDGTVSGDQSDVDCGGSCEPCAAGKACNEDSDCVTDLCVDGVCVLLATCDDGIKNGEETDVDCGGPDCPPCPENHLCEQDSDCHLDNCWEGICNADGDHCENGVMDGDETDIDCGGSCPPCGYGFGCENNSDCAAGTFILCVDGVCGGALNTCGNWIQDGRETDVDCGGPHCPPCDVGMRCLVDSDCASNECQAGTCTAPEWTCDNGVTDGHETDIDCGGPACPPCEDGFRCEFHQDCLAGYCANGFCAGEFVCDDGVKNGHETDVDCGGPLCPPCRSGSACLVDADCASGECAEGTCVFADTCGDGVMNGGETDVDCGGPYCVPCEVGNTCQQHTDCEARFCMLPESAVPGLGNGISPVDAGVCVYTIQYIQSGDASVNCTASGRNTIMEGITLSPVIIVSDAFTIDESTDGYYVAWDPTPDNSPSDDYSGILVAVDKSLELGVGNGDTVSITGDYVEDDCMSTIVVDASSGSVEPADTNLSRPIPYFVQASVFEQGGGPATERVEGMVVQLNATVTDVTGHDGPEGPGEPRWWFKAGDDIFIANDFGLTNLPEVDDSLEITGAVKYIHGVYLIVPLQESHIRERGGFIPLGSP